MSNRTRQTNGLFHPFTYQKQWKRYDSHCT